MRHLIYGGSSAERTLACPGWIKASENAPKRAPGAAAVTGSMHHMVQEACQIDDVLPNDCLGMVYKEGAASQEFTEADLELSETGYNAANKIMDELDIEQLLIEPFVQFIPDLAGGSIDLLGVSADQETLMILDFKFGRVKVAVEDSAQHFTYTISARADKHTKDLFSKIKKIIFVIVQPQVDREPITWECTLDDVDDFKQKFIAAMDSTELHPGPHCKYCPVSPYCKKLRADVVGAKSLGVTNKDELQIAADHVEEVEHWLNNVKQELFVQVSRGVAIKGWKIVEKQSKRVWLDEAVTEVILKAAKVVKNTYTKTVMLTAPQTVAAFKKAKAKTTFKLTAAQVKAALKKAKIKYPFDKKQTEFSLDDLIEKKSSGTTLAPVHDDRDAVSVSDVPDNLANLMKSKK